MPSRAPKPCRTPSCGGLSRDGSGYCNNHQKQKCGWNTPNRGTRHQRGYGSAWVKIRKRILKRDKGLCQPCMKLGLLSTANTVDHIIPKAEGGTDDANNLQAICDPCHNAKTRQESQGKKYEDIGCNADGLPFSNTHHWNT